MLPMSATAGSASKGQAERTKRTITAACRLYETHILPCPRCDFIETVALRNGEGQPLYTYLSYTLRLPLVRLDSINNYSSLSEYSAIRRVKKKGRKGEEEYTLAMPRLSDRPSGKVTVDFLGHKGGSAVAFLYLCWPVDTAPSSLRFASTANSNQPKDN